MARYPTRCQIVDVTGQEVFPGVIGNTPDVSRQHVGKYGTAELMPDWNVRITLDDGNVLFGYECWWESVPSNNGFQRTGQVAPSTVLDGFMEQQGETARR